MVVVIIGGGKKGRVSSCIYKSLSWKIITIKILKTNKEKKEFLNLTIKN